LQFVEGYGSIPLFLALGQDQGPKVQKEV
jgi:hypothetical protein